MISLTVFRQKIDMAGKQKLELNWIGKNKRLRLEAWILVKVEERLYRAKIRAFLVDANWLVPQRIFAQIEDNYALDDLRKGRVREPFRAYFVTTVLAERDAAHFRNFYCARIAISQMRNLHDDGVLNTLAWVVMPDHVHWLFQLGQTVTLPGGMKAYKAHTARRVNDYLNRRGALWQKAYYDHALREEEDIRAIARYIVANPLRADLVENIGDYPHWDAIWL